MSPLSTSRRRAASSWRTRRADRPTLGAPAAEAAVEAKAAAETAAAATVQTRVTAADFARAALHGCDVLEAEVAKLQAGQNKRPAELYGLVEITLYAARNLRFAISLGSDAEERRNLGRIVAHVEAALSKDDVPSAVGPFLEQSPHSKAVRAALQRLCRVHVEFELPLPPPSAAVAALPPPRAGASSAEALMGTTLPGTQLPALGFGT
eukprot:6795839-Prymnesium_polylepis.1